MPSKPTTVDEYLASVPAERREALVALRKLFKSHLDRKYVEGISYGMIGWSVPHSVFPAGYHCNPALPLPFAALASQKAHMSLHLLGLYCDQVNGKPGPLLRWFEDAWKRSGKKLDMGKAILTTSSSNLIESTFLYLASVSGKCSPILPRPQAPRIASATACATTSASLWPISPRSPLKWTPPKISFRSVPADSTKR